MRIRNRFEQLIREVESKPFLELLEADIGPALAEPDLRDMENSLNIELSKEVRAFYSQVNGVKVYWRLSEKYDPSELGMLIAACDDFPAWVGDDPDNPFARIGIVPFGESFSKEWFDYLYGEEEIFSYQGRDYHLGEFAKMVKPFDLYSAFACTAFVLEKNELTLMQLSGHYDDWKSSRIIAFDAYIELVLRSRGIVAARDEVLSSYQGYSQPVLTLEAIRRSFDEPQMFGDWQQGASTRK